MSGLLKLTLLPGIVAALLLAGSASARVTDEEPSCEPHCMTSPAAATPGATSAATASTSVAASTSGATAGGSAAKAVTVTVSARVKAADLTFAKSKTTTTLKLAAALGHALGTYQVTIKPSTRCFLGSASATCASLYAKLGAAAKVSVAGPKAGAAIVATKITLAA